MGQGGRCPNKSRTSARPAKGFTKHAAVPFTVMVEKGSLVGTQIGPYQLTRVIGEGGMGSVFEAVHKALGCLGVITDGSIRDIPQWAPGFQALAGRGIEARVLNMATVRPIDIEAVVAAARETGAILTAEEHSVHGGLGSAIAEVVVAERPVPMKILGVPGIFAPTGSAEFLLDEFGMAPPAVTDAAQALIARKTAANA